MSPTKKMPLRFFPAYGFTLIELLIVITIISVLLSLLIPTLGQARMKALQISCSSRQRQAGVGLNIYMTDFREWLPLMRNDATGFSFQPRPGVDQSPQYLADVFPKPLRICPTYNPLSVNMGPLAEFGWGYAFPFQTSYYAANGLMDDRVDNEDDPSYVRVKPGKAREKAGANWYSYSYDPTNDIFPLMADYLQDANDNLTISPHSPISRNAGYLGHNVITSDGANSLWRDGHVEWHNWFGQNGIYANQDWHGNYPIYLANHASPLLGNGSYNGWTWPGNIYFRYYYWMKGENGG